MVSIETKIGYQHHSNIIRNTEGRVFILNEKKADE